MCTRAFSRHFFAPFVYVLPFLNFMFVRSHENEVRHCLCMLELRQPYYDHLVIQSKKSLNCFNKTQR